MKYYDECFFVNYDAYQDLALYEIGCQKCPPDYSFGPIIRENYVLHYIISGKGTLYLDNKDFSVSGKPAFITPPHLPAYYKADTEHPWNYIWIHLNGEKAFDLLSFVGISKTQPIFIPSKPCPEIENCILEMLHNTDLEFECVGNLYRLFQYMIDVSSTRPQPDHVDNTLKYIKDTITYISGKFNEPIKVQEIADHCGLDRSYLSKIFKQATNYSPQEYLIYYRIKKAKQLLKNTELTIQHVAYAVGYPDPFAFSKIFKKETGFSPSEYRVNLLKKSKEDY